MKKYGKREFIYISIGISIVGLIGFLLPYGNEKWNFIFENLMWFPIELAITVFILEKMLEENNERKKMVRFFNLAGIETNDLISIVKAKLYSAYTGDMFMDDDNSEKKLVEIYTEFNKKYNKETFNNGVDIYIVDFRESLFENNKKVKISYIVSILNFSEEINKIINDYLSKNEIFLPEEVFNEIVSLRNILQNSDLFRVDSTFQDKANLWTKSPSMSEETKLNILCEMEMIYKKTIDSLDRLNKIMKDMPPS